MSLSYMTIQSFAMEIQMSVEYLIQQFLNIGIIKTKFDFVTKSERDMLLDHMCCNNIATFNKFSLQRKTHSTLHVSSIGGKNKKVKVEVRKKRTYMVQSYTKKNDLFDEVQKVLKHKNTLNTNSEKSVNKVKENISICNEDNSINSSMLSHQIPKQSDQSCSNMIKTQGQLDIHTSIKNNEISQDICHIKPPLHDKENVLFKCDVIEVNTNNVHKNEDNNISESNQLSNFKIKNNNLKLTNERRHNSRTRLKHKVSGKIIRQKRNNNHYSYIDSIDEESYTEEKLYSINRIHKSKRKQSTLIHRFNKPVQTVPKNIVVGETISVLELSNRMSIKSSYMIKIMMKLGLMVTVNQIIDQETAQLVIEEMGHNFILRRENELESLIMNNCYHSGKIDKISTNVKHDNFNYKIRPPIVTIMGHVDHGKTSLLDCIRAINTVNTECGGITQSIKACQVKTKSGDTITFLDTPGHEAFSKMRMRGAKLTDIVILVIAADDGVMPQTVESIQHIQSDNIPVIVAINKIDKLGTNVDVIKHALNKYGLVPEEWGGDTQFINVSARSGFGIDNLLDAILLQAEVLELKTIHYGIAKGVVIEGFLDKGRGPIIVVLIREGELKCGDIVLCGSEYGRVKAIRDEFGNNISKAGPSIPVELLGLSGIPDSGEIMIVLSNEKQARELALYRKNKRREITLAHSQDKYPTKHVFDHITNINNITELNFIVKSDTQGSIEAICESLKNLSTNEVIIKIIFSAVGNVTETDSVLALTSTAIILAFNVKSDFTARRVIESNSLRIHYFSIIYDLLDEVKRIINNSLTPKYEYKIIGIAEVHNIFHSSKYGVIAGCMVVEGVIKINKKIKIIRNNIVIHEGELESLRHFKNNVNEIRSGVECGIAIKDYYDICSGDIIKVLDKFSVPCYQ